MKLKPGQYSPIITVMNPMAKQLVGFRIVKLMAKEPAGQRELADPRVQEAIRSQLRDRREQLLKAAYYEVLRDQAKVENYYAEQNSARQRQCSRLAHSTIASTSPAFTFAAFSGQDFLNVPFLGDLISFCIFMASTTSDALPGFDLTPSLHQHPHHLARHGRDQLCGDPSHLRLARLRLRSDRGSRNSAA